MASEPKWQQMMVNFGVDACGDVDRADGGAYDDACGGGYDDADDDDHENDADK